LRKLIPGQAFLFLWLQFPEAEISASRLIPPALQKFTVIQISAVIQNSMAQHCHGLSYLFFHLS
ncbi:MAG: hypothetical protein IIY77_02440, partial [Lachnospiraceae bacterium]|nr:hypothetical protein [Lachnospiraceae bacterium]